MPNYYIPVTNDPDQSFICSIPLGGKNVQLRFRIRYNSEAKYWWMTISDSKGKVLIDSLPLLSGGNLLEQYRYLGLGKAYIVSSGNTILEDPDDLTLGTDFLLMWGD